MRNTRIAPLQAELNILENAGKKLKGIEGKPRDINNARINRMKSNIWGRINTACNSIEKHCPKLAKHFRDTTKSIDSSYYIYTPGVPDMNWDTTKKH